MKPEITIQTAKALLGRCERRIYQLLLDGELVRGEFQGSILTSSVLRYKRKLDNGTVRRGRPRLAKSNGKQPKGK